MIIRWSEGLKNRLGWSHAKDISVLSRDCFKNPCFHAHDWNHDGRLVCLTRDKNGCPSIPINNKIEPSPSGGCFGCRHSTGGEYTHYDSNCFDCKRIAHDNYEK